MLGDHRRMRAELDEDCPALDFYGGFYLQLAGRPAVRRPRRHPLAHGRKLHDRAVQAARAQVSAGSLARIRNRSASGPTFLDKRKGFAQAAAVAATAVRKPRPIHQPENQ